MLWVFLGQMLLVVASLFCALFWSDIFPARFCQVILTALVLVSPLVYLAVLAKPIMRLAWRQMLRDTLALIISITRAAGRLFLPSTFMRLVRFIALLKPAPTTLDEWITLCVLPFKTCVAATFPVIWVFEKVLSYFSYFRPYGRTFGLSYELLGECFLFSLLGLLIGALVQALFCRAGRVTVTLRFFLLGLVLLFVTALSSMVRI